MRNSTKFTLTALALLGGLGLTAAQSTLATGTPASAEPQQRKGGRQPDIARLESLVTRYDDARAKADAKALLGIEDDLKVVLSGGRGQTAKSGAAAAPTGRPQEISKEIGGLLGKMDDPSVGRKSELLHELLDLSRAEAAKGEPK